MPTSADPPPRRPTGKLRSRRLRSRLFPAALFGLVAMAACDDSFSPIAPSGLRFSIFGYLDASADTQWVRVMPLRELLPTEPGPLGAAVALENVATGQRIELRDSVFRFSTNPDVGSEGRYLHNYWTTEKIDPGAAYRFSVSHSEQESAEALIEIPPEYELEVWYGQASSQVDLVHLVGLEHLAMVIMIISYHDGCGGEVQRNLMKTRIADPEAIMVQVNPKVRGSRQSCGGPQVDRRELLIVGSGAAWPAGLQYDESDLGVSRNPSNVSNSVGFLGGVLTRRVPFENCRIDSPQPYHEHCRLRYDESSVTLQGTVRSTCGEAPIARAIVELRELDPVVAGAPKVRVDVTDGLGGYSIGALEPGMRYGVDIGRRAIDRTPEFLPYTDTLEFTAGATVTYEPILRPRASC